MMMMMHPRVYNSVTLDETHMEMSDLDTVPTKLAGVYHYYHLILHVGHYPLYSVGLLRIMLHHSYYLDCCWYHYRC